MFCAASVLLVLTLAAYHAEARLTRLSKRDPSSDPFYAQPSNACKCKPGTIFRSRSITPSLNGQSNNAATTNGVNAWELLYCTTGANSTTFATVTTVFQPQKKAKKDALIGFASAEDSAYINCAPSNAYQQGQTSNNAINDSEENMIVAFLDQGYTVTSPDYEGPNSAFSAGILEGHGVLDSMRAAIAFKPLKFTKNVKIAGSGYSGGAIATGHAAAAQPTYAPELPIIAWAFGGTPANISQTLQFLDGGLFAGFAFGGTAGLSQAYLALSNLYGRTSTAAGRAAFDYLFSHCATDDIEQFAFKRIQSTTYQSEGDRIIYDPVVQKIVSANVIGVKKSQTPTAPTYVYHSLYDEIIPYSGAAAMVDRFCSHGIKSLIFETDIGPSEHASGEILFAPNVINFINDRFAGKPAQKGCRRTKTVLPLLDPKAAPTELRNVYGMLQNDLLNYVGPNDSILKARITAGAAARGNTPSTSNQAPNF